MTENGGDNNSGETRMRHEISEKEVDESLRKHILNPNDIEDGVKDFEQINQEERGRMLEDLLVQSVQEGKPDALWGKNSTAYCLAIALRVGQQFSYRTQAELLYESNRRAVEKETIEGRAEINLPDHIRENIVLARNRGMHLAKILDDAQIAYQPLSQYKLAHVSQKRV